MFQPKDSIDSTIHKLICDRSLSAPLKEAILYVLFPSGKKLRPRIALSIIKDLITESSAFDLPIAALELVHVASLVHDDLPSIDNDDFRRGRLTCHKVYGEATAVLVGDILNAIAFEAITYSKANTEQIARLAKSLSTAFTSICDGQHCDLMTGDSRPDLEVIHRLKTGSLFRASFEFGAILSDQTDDIERQFGEIGEELGIIFQITDDLLDRAQDPRIKGRPSGSDKRQGKQTFADTTSLEDWSRIDERVEGVIYRINKLEEFAAKKLTNLQLVINEMLQQHQQYRESTATKKAV